MRVYGSRISYYTGKLECYLRDRGIGTPTSRARATACGVSRSCAGSGPRWRTRRGRRCARTSWGPGRPCCGTRTPSRRASGYDPEHRAPFNRAIDVFASGVPE